MSWQVIHGDCLDALRAMPDASVDAVVTDPPYGLSFMGKKWDYDVPATEVWAECLRVLKPGGHLLAFAGTRTQHRMCVRIEDAGFEIRDMIAWVYGSGFPKSHDVSKAIDREAGAQRGRTTVRSKSVSTCYAQDDWTRVNAGTVLDAEPITDAASKWVGWGTALKPAMEPITVARKPLTGTVAENVQEWGTGAINVDGCRVGTDAGWSYPSGRGGSGWHGRESLARNLTTPMRATLGRWPANLIHDGSDEVVAGFPVTTSGKMMPTRTTAGVEGRNAYGADAAGGFTTMETYGDSGSAARFFYCAKASKADRDGGCESLQERARPTMGNGIGGQPDQQRANNRNHHPTVKPTALMQYLCRLVTPPGGTVLDPFTGSGSTGKAAILEGFNFIGIEREAEYVEIARARIADAERRHSESLVSA